MRVLKQLRVQLYLSSLVEALPSPQRSSTKDFKLSAYVQTFLHGASVIHSNTHPAITLHLSVQYFLLLRKRCGSVVTTLQTPVLRQVVHKVFPKRSVFTQEMGTVGKWHFTSVTPYKLILTRPVGQGATFTYYSTQSILANCSQCDIVPTSLLGGTAITTKAIALQTSILVCDD